MRPSMPRTACSSSPPHHRHRHHRCSLPYEKRSGIDQRVDGVILYFFLFAQSLFSRLACNLIAPDGPPDPRVTSEQFDLRQLGIHLLDHVVGFVGLAAVLTPWRFDDRARLICRLGGWKLATSADEQQFMLVPNP